MGVYTSKHLLSTQEFEWSHFHSLDFPNSCIQFRHRLEYVFSLGKPFICANWNSYSLLVKYFETHGSFMDTLDWKISFEQIRMHGFEMKKLDSLLLKYNDLQNYYFPLPSEIENGQINIFLQ